MATPKKNISPENALNRLAALCSRSEQAECDLRAKLSSWAVAPNDADRIIARLYEMRFIDRNRYACAFVRDKFRFEGWGKIKISYQLRQKGFDDNAIADALTEIPDDEYAERLHTLLAAKVRSIKNKPYMQAKAALVRFAASRGFEPDIIYRTIPQVLTYNSTNPCDDDDDNCQDAYFDD